MPTHTNTRDTKSQFNTLGFCMCYAGPELCKSLSQYFFGSLGHCEVSKNAQTPRFLFTHHFEPLLLTHLGRSSRASRGRSRAEKLECVGKLPIDHPRLVKRAISKGEAFGMMIPK